MKFSSSTQSLIKETLQQALTKYRKNSEQSAVTDIYLQALQGSGELYIFNDEEEELAVVMIEEWMKCAEEDFYKGVERELSALLSKMKEEGTFDKLTLLQPYSFVLVDEEKETVSELLLMDQETEVVNEELLKGLDEELNSFLKDLLER